MKGKLMDKNIEFHESSFARKSFVVIFLIVVVFAIGFRIYKANFAGIIYDERANFRLFGTSLDRATKVYTTTNNHVLNSVFMYYSHKYFSAYEHFIRIPSIIASVLFVLSLAYIIHKTVLSKPLQIASFALISLIPHVVDYSFLARGYAFAMAAIFVQIAFILWLMDNKLRYVFWPLPVVVISLMNFLAFGAILSSILLLAAINFTFIFIYSNTIYRPKTLVPDTIRHRPGTHKRRKKRATRKPNAMAEKVSLFEKKWFPPILNLTSIAILSSVMIGMLYRHIYNDIINNPVLKDISKQMAGWEDFVEFLRLILVQIVFKPHISPGRSILTVVLVVLLIAIAFHAYMFLRAIKQKKWRDRLGLNNPATFIFIITALTLMLMFIQCVVMRKGLGLMRNHIFFTPLAIICAVVVLDRFGMMSGQKVPGHIVRMFLAAAVLAIILHNSPSPYFVSRQGMSGILLRQLHSLDSQKMWTIGFVNKAKNRMIGFWYYKTNFPQKYKCRLIETKKYKQPLESYDVLVCENQDRPKEKYWHKLEFFSPQRYSVMVNLAHLPKDKAYQLIAKE